MGSWLVSSSTVCSSSSTTVVSSKVLGFFFLLVLTEALDPMLVRRKKNMVISSSSQQQGLEHDDTSGYRTGQNSDVAVAPPPNVIRLWQEVALGIDRSQTGKRNID